MQEIIDLAMTETADLNSDKKVPLVGYEDNKTLGI
jgi:hypothetical protein